jgi:aldehyde dehydrogenase
MPRVLERIGAITQGSPLDPSTMLGPQVSAAQLAKIQSYVEIGRGEGAEVLIGGDRNVLEGELAEGYYHEPTVLKGTNDMRVFQEEIFGPVVSVTTFKDEAQALEIANDTMYGLGAGVWTRDGSRAYRMGRAIKAGRVWTNCYHLYPAHAAFGGYKASGVGRENHKMMLDHYSQTKNLLVSYDPKAMGFF